MGGDFNVTLFPHGRSREGRLTFAMRSFSTVTSGLELVDLPMLEG